MNKSRAAAILLAGGVAAGVAVASGAPPDAVPTPDIGSAARPAPGAGGPSELDLRRWPTRTFYQNLTRRIEALSAAHGPERPRVFLDMAELYLSQALLYEAGSVLDGVEAETPHDKRRKQAIGDAVTLLRGAPVDDFRSSPLAAPRRADRGMWLVLQAIAAGDGVMLRNNLADALGALAHASRPVARVVLPILAEAAVEVGEARLAGQAILLMEEFPGLANAPVGHYLRGRAAEVQGNAKTALEAYFEGARGWDRYAARARLAVADMALSDGGRGALLAARDVLEYGAGAWRGDRYEMQLLQRLSAIYSKTGEPFPALVARGKLMLRFPGTEAAAEAAAQAGVDMAAVYRDGAEGRLPLAKWVTVHMDLVPLYRFFPDFPLYSEMLADRALEIGGTDLAATEYRRALSLLEEQGEFSGRDVPAERLTGLRLKLARALSRGGLYAEARRVLEAIQAPGEPALRRRLNAMKSEVLAELGDTDGVLRTHVADPDARNLRNLALALWKSGNWTEAALFYKRLWAQFPEEFSARDASYLLLAAHKSGDEATANKVVAAFPGLTNSESWVEIAESLLEAPASLLPLSRDAAATRLESADRAVERVEGRGTGF